MKAATLYLRYILNYEVISIHAAREGGDLKVFKSVGRHFCISIHAAREGGDHSLSITKSTQRENISIHAAREGGDWRRLHE